MVQDDRLQHVIITRFNCRFGNVPQHQLIKTPESPKWLEERFELFEKYCCPTMVNQSSSNFLWYIYFDINTPKEFLDRARRDTQNRPNILIKLCEVYTIEVLMADLVRDIPPDCDWLVTTRLDNDDGLHADFVARLQKAVRRDVREALNVPMGLVLGRDRLYLSRQPSNAFVSMSEPFEGFRTVFCASHNQIGAHVPVRDVGGTEPGWLQVIHGGNISNKLRGHRIPRADLPAGFEAVTALRASDGARDSRRQIAFENVTLGLLRTLRDHGARGYRALRRLAETRR